MDHTQVNGTAALQERLSDPDVAASLNRLLDRADALDRAMAQATQLMEMAPGMLAFAADTFDDVSRQVAETTGAGMEERLRGSVALLAKLTEPKTVEVLSALMERMDQLEQLVQIADQLPGLLAMFVDITDEVARRAQEAGINMHTTLEKGVHAGVRLNEFMTSGALETLLDSGVLDPRAVGIVGMLGSSMVKCQDECLKQPKPKELGPIGALRAMRSPDVQRALGFLVNLGRFFGEGIEEYHAEHTGRALPQNGAAEASHA